MKIINVGSVYEIYSDDAVKTFDSLPAATYKVRFSKMSGFFLEKVEDLVVDGKIYGSHERKTNKVLASYDVFDKNLGVILSGAKGIGKSLFARILANKAINKNLPVILVDVYIPGIADFLSSIHQECMVLFDEFEKTFDSERFDEGQDPQSTLLGLFDGTSNGKKLFVITCNNVYRLNEFFINRTGRFHYHFRFTHPTSAEITEYLNDNVVTNNNKEEEISKIISFSRKVPLTFDSLHSIAFELNSGENFEDIIEDLNILNTKNTVERIAEIYFSNGDVFTCDRYHTKQIELFKPRESSLSIYDMNDNYCGTISANFYESKYSVEEDCLVYEGNFKFSLDEDMPNYKDYKEKNIHPIMAKIYSEYNTVANEYSFGYNRK